MKKREPARGGPSANEIAPKVMDDLDHRAISLDCASYSKPLTLSTTFSAVMPKYLNNSPAGADSPKVSIPMTGPSSTYLDQPAVTPASTATRGMPRGRTASRYAASWRSNTLVQGMDTTRTAMPSVASACRALTAS